MFKMVLGMDRTKQIYRESYGGFQKEFLNFLIGGLQKLAGSGGNDGKEMFEVLSEHPYGLRAYL